MGQSLAIIAMSNFPLDCLDPYVQFLCSSYLDPTGTGLGGGSPATRFETLFETPPGTLWDLLTSLFGRQSESKGR